MADDTRPRMIRPPDNLKRKVIAGGPGAVAPDVLEKAEAAITGLTGNYLQWVEDDLTRIQEAYETLAAASGAETKAALDKVFLIAHDMKGQGGSFGYDLITIVGNQLCRLIEKMDEIGRSEMEVIRLHVETMKLVITKDMRGDGGPQGAQLLKGLEQVVAKVSSAS